MQLGENVTIVSRFRKELVAKNDWRICLFETNEKDKIPTGGEDLPYFTVKGIISPKYAGESFELTGEWSRYKKNNELQFTLQYAVPCVPKNKKDALEFVKNSTKGIGKKIAAAIVDWCDGDIQKVAEDPMVAAASIKGLSERRAKLLAKHIEVASATAALTKLLKKVVDPQVIRRLVTAYGSNAFDTVTKDPYSTTRIIGFDAADKIALAQDYKPKKPERIDAAVIAALLALRAKNCSIVVQKPAHFYQTMELLSCNIPKINGNVRPIEEALVNESVYRLKQQKKIASTAGSNGFLYLREDFDMEKALAKRILELGAQTPTEQDAAKFCAAFEQWKKEHPNIQLHPNQEAAVYAASNLFSVVTGGPGTGKTTVLKAIMETYERIYPDGQITLMAPTGLAAKRMTESCERPAKTIHKTLGLIPADTPSRFEAPCDGQKLAGGLIIVDEFSMVGIHLANFLIDATDCTPGTHIVFVGDVDQLPSVTPGAILRDLIDCGKVHVTRLTKNYRQASGSMIADVAVKVNTGNTRDLNFSKDCVFTEVPENAIVQRVIDEFTKSVGEYGFDNTYVITPTHKSDKDPLSSNMLNKKLQEIINPPVEGRLDAVSGERHFRVGDRVINKKNATDVINGDIGKVVEVISEDVGATLKIDFSGEIIEFPPERLKNLELAYAITVHSSQGCEFKSVIMPISYSHRFMLTRNLVYTAITRAKVKMNLIGNKNAMLAAVLNTKTGGVSDLLCARLAAQ